MSNEPIVSADGAEANIGAAATRRMAGSLFGSKSLWTAILVTLLGAVSWGYSALTKPEPTTAAASPMASTLSASSAVETPPSDRLIDKSAPRTVRYGLSFIGAFLVAYVVKKIIKSVLIVAALVFAAIAALKYFGIFEYDWSSAQQQVEHGVELAREESGRLAKLATEYLPSSVAGGLGAIMGARRG